MTEANRTDVSLGGPLSDAVLKCYHAGEDDEALEPIVLTEGDGSPVGRIDDGDYVIFYDIRGEREVQLTASFVEPGFNHFPVKEGMRTGWATMIEYDPELDVKVAYPPEGKLVDTLCDVVAKQGLQQSKVVETEKAIHLGFFFNGKRQEPFDGEVRDFVPTPKDIAFFDERPEMEAHQVAERMIAQLRRTENKLVVGNFANVDVVGHLEDASAVLKAVETVDTCAGKVLAAAKEAGVAVLVTADHGTVESRLYPEGSIDTGHTDSRVPLILVTPEGWSSEQVTLAEGDSLIDVAPTALDLLGLERPETMTGRNLLPEGYAERLFGDRDRRVMVLILDGWGIGDPKAPEGGDLIREANTPVVDELFATCPHTTLAAAGTDVGLPDGTVGNSESGHLHLGSGRVVYSDRMRIERDMQSGAFNQNEAFRWAIDGAIRDGRPLHLLGIISFFSSHGSLNHLYALMEMAAEAGVPELYIHGLLGRRGERPEAGARYVGDVERKASELGLGRFATVIGRHWALDREENWDRIEKTYRTLVHGEGRQVADTSS